MQSNVLHVRHVNYQPKKDTHTQFRYSAFKMLSILDIVSANIYYCYPALVTLHPSVCMREKTLLF